MKNRNPARGVLALLIAVTAAMCLYLPACSSGLKDPVGNGGVKDWVPVLSEEEAKELFGAESAQYTKTFDYPYLYYPGKLYPNSDNGKLTVYRFNCETGESEYACQDSVCTHDAGSGCPFEKYGYFGQLSVINGRVVYTTKAEPYALEWYDPKTREHKVLAEDGDNCYVLGDSLYYTRGELVADDAEGKPTLHRQLWKYDMEKEKATMVASINDANDYRIEPVLTGGEEKIALLSHYAYDGELDGELLYLYWIDAKTGERTPVLKEGISSSGWYVDSGNYFCYSEPVNYDRTTGFAESNIVYLVDLSTGEKKILVENELLDASTIIPTEKYFLALCDDPSGEADKILRCYGLDTGKLEKEYPLTGDYTGIFLRYYRGRLYLFTSWKADGQTMGMNAEPGGYLEWDILTGEQRLVPYSVVQ